MLLKKSYRLASHLFVAVFLGLISGGFMNLQASNCCSPPDDLDYDCSDLPYGFDPYDLDQLQSLFGEPVQKCSGYWWTELTPEVELNTCNIGSITRQFEFINGYGKKDTCTQEVTVVGVHAYQIYFPKDASAYCEVPEPEPLIKREQACDLLAVNKKDLLFGTSSSGCYKILRTYKVIDWCEYDGESPAVRIGRDEDCDGDGGDEGVWLTRIETGTVFLDRDDELYNAIPDGDDNPCTGTSGYWKNSKQESRLQSTGSWQYTQHIKVFDDVLPEVTSQAADPFCSISNTCEGDVTVSFEVDETCSADALTIKVFLFADGMAVPLTEENNIASEVLSGDFPSYQISGRYPIGDHLFEVHVKDGCGNTGFAEIPFSVVDCKAPTPICYHGISTTLMPLEDSTDIDEDGDFDAYGGVVWVSDLIRSDVFDCSEPITYSINRVGETPDPLKDDLILTCEDADTVQVEVYAWDSAFNPYALQPDSTTGGANYAHCKTYIVIRGDVCPEEIPPAMIAGRVMTYTGMPVEQVEIQVTGSMEMQAMTRDDGGYELNVMPHQQYFLTPHKEDYFMNGVNTEDVIALTNHIMGRHRITNPYQLIAADINHSGHISLFDLVYLRKAVMGEMSAFPNNTSWRFIPASHVFIDSANPWATPIPEFEAVDDMPMPMRWANFYAVKVGDVDNSLSADAGRSLVAQTYLSLENPYLEAGQTYTLAISLAERPELIGLQFELFFDRDQVGVEEWEAGLLSKVFMGTNRLEEGILAVSWNSLDGQAGPGDGALFTLTIRAKQSGFLQDMLSLNERRIKAEGYGDGGTVSQMALQFEEINLQDQFYLGQNNPNPFRESTQISFYLPEAKSVRLRVFDLNGRLVHSQEASFGVGEQQFSLSRMDLGQAGVFVYVLEAGEWRGSRRMVLLP
jgi:hypothetical protein